MKKTISILLIGAIPAFVLAGGGDGTEQHKHAEEPTEHATEQHEHATEPHKHASEKHDDAKKEHGHGGDMGHGEHEVDTGRPGDPANVSRTIEVTMDDTMRFTPDQFNIKPGETLRFAVRNIGVLSHEMVIGSMAELKEHAEMMRAMPTMQHAESNMLTLAPGQSGDIIWQFGEPGTIDVACLVPGHLEAGMKGVIEVE
jgi:uncharacterized cupredoxin-like copper-binding protein